MGKGKKRQNPGVGVDFRKVKHKVGKKLPKAQNETKTDFQSRSINLPNQSVAQDKAGAAVSDRNLTLKELVNQLSHHNTHTRRDALSGLEQLISAHPTEATKNAALLLEALATRVSDGEQPVRTALVSLLRTATLPAVGPAVLSPFLPMLMAHLSAALTHLSADVRLDALAVLEAITEAAPQLMSADQQLQAALAHYSGLLSRTNRGKSVKSQALSGLLKVLSSLERFLTAALPAAAASGKEGGRLVGTTSTSSSDSSEAAQKDSTALSLFAFRAATAPVATVQLPAAQELLQLYTSSSTVPQQQQQLAAGASPVQSAASAPGAVSLQQQSLQLLLVLFDCWAEAAPASLSVAPEQESAAVLVHILACTHLLLAHLSPVKHTAAAAPAAAAAAATMGSSSALCIGFETSRDKAVWINQAAAAVLPKLLRVFPVPAAPMTPASAQLQEQLQRFNLLAAQILTHLVAAGVQWPPLGGTRAAAAAAGATAGVAGSGGRGRGSSSSKAELAACQGWEERLLQFMAGMLTTGSCWPSSDPDLELTAATATVEATDHGTAAKQGDRKQQRRMPSSNSSRSSTSSSSSSGVLVVLQCLQQLLPHLTHQQRQQLLVAVGHLAAPAQQQQSARTTAATNISSSVKVACLQLQLQLMLDYLHAAVPDSEQEAGIAAWVAAAPRWLWECGSTRPHMSKLLLLYIYHAARLSLPGSLIQQQLVQTQQQLAPLFATALPAGSKRQQRPAAAAAPAVAAAVPVLLGPLAALPADLQSLAFDVLCFQPQLQQPLLKAVALSSRLSSYPDAAVLRLLDSVLAAAGSSVPPEQYLSFVATLLSPGPAGGYVDRSTGSRIDSSFSRHQLMVDAVCCWLHTYGPAQELLPLLLPVMLQQWKQQVAAASGAAAGSNAFHRVRSCSYSCASLAALAVGCWRSFTSTAVVIGDTPSAHVCCLADDVMQQLPAVMVAYCLSSRQVASAALQAVVGAVDTAEAPAETPAMPAPPQHPHVSTAAGLVGGGEDTAEVAAVDNCMSLLMPLLAGAPESLLLPFLEQYVSGVLQSTAATDGGGVAGSSWTAAAGGPAHADKGQDRIAVAVHVLTVVLKQQKLRACLLSHVQHLQQLVGKLATAAEDLRQRTGEGVAVQQVQMLQSATALVFGH